VRADGRTLGEVNRADVGDVVQHVRLACVELEEDVAGLGGGGSGSGGDVRVFRDYFVRSRKPTERIEIRSKKMRRS
jgi:hypothetical protein